MPKERQHLKSQLKLAADRIDRKKQPSGGNFCHQMKQKMSFMVTVKPLTREHGTYCQTWRCEFYTAGLFMKIRSHQLEGLGYS